MCAPDVQNHFLPIKRLLGGQEARGPVCEGLPSVQRGLGQRKWELTLPGHRQQAGNGCAVVLRGEAERWEAWPDIQSAWLWK